MFKSSAESFINNVLFVLTALIIISCSYDIFLQVKISNFNIRFSVICMILSIFFYFLKIAINRDTKVSMVAPLSLFLWIATLVAFVGNTNFISRNILYLIWLMIYVLFIFTMNQLSDPRYFIRIFRIYIYSFGFLGAIGIMQFLLFFIFKIDFYVEQVFALGLPRINGFSYEPSYFATFMLTGFVMNLYLINHKSQYFKFKHLLINQFFIFVSILLSTSKMVVPLVIAILLLTSFQDMFSRLRTGFAIYYKDLFLFPLVFVLLAGGVYMFLFQFKTISFLFDGLGVGGTVSHSVEGRSLGFEQTYTVFKKSPFIGYSLGGIPSAIGELKGLVITDNETAKENEGMNIFMETLAGSGVIGFLFFLTFLYQLLTKPLRQAKFLWSTENFKEDSIILKSIFWGGLVLLLMLNFNQNILRPYLWVHFGFLSLSYFYSKNLYKQNSEL